MVLDSVSRIRRALYQQLDSLRAAGIAQFPEPSEALLEALRQTSPADGGKHVRKPTQASLNIAHHEQVVSNMTVESPSLLQDELSMTSESSAAATLEILNEEVVACTVCDELAGARTQTVFGVGNRNADLCFLGEAPGADEDRLGEPFVGRAGQLLNKILEACGLHRDEVYILNILKCRPPGNRNPMPNEAANCRKFLDRQLELINPQFICCLGAVAAQNLLDTQKSIGKLRGQIHVYRERNVACTYHPAYLLRNPSAKKYVWDDMKMLMRKMGKPLD